MPSQRKPLSLIKTIQAPAFPTAWASAHIFCLQIPAPPPCLEVVLNLDHLVPDLGEVAAGLDQLVHLLVDQVRGGVLPASAGTLGIRLPATSLAATEQDEGKEEDEKEEEQSYKEEN